MDLRHLCDWICNGDSVSFGMEIRPRKKTKIKDVENKRPTRCNRLFFYCKIYCSLNMFGHHYAHHQELKSYKDGCCLWYLALWFTGRWSGVEL